MRIVILGSSLDAICVAHTLFDLSSEFEIQIITERAEIGLMGEVPGIISSWPPCSSAWISEMASQTPTKTSTAVRGSWFVKALGIQLSKRGCKFHLRTRIINNTETEIKFVGAGSLGEAQIPFDHLLDMRTKEQGHAKWYGIVCRTEDTPESAYTGQRSDGTTEAWSTDNLHGNKAALQEMIWAGSDPTSYISSAIMSGIQIAHEVADTIIHPIEQ